MILHTSMGLYLNDPLWNNGKRHWKINRILEEIQRADKIGIKWAVIHIGTAMNKKRSDVIDNINEILKELVQQQLEIGILLENSASNNCYGATIPDLMYIVNSIDQRLRFSNKEKTKKRIGICFDTQHYYAAGGGKRIDEYQNIYNMYGHEIIVTHVNNSLLEVIFGKGMDKHAHILDPEAKIPIEVYQMIVGHKEVYAMILETPSNELSEQIAQIHEVAKLREFANDVLNKETIQEEWSKKKDQELKEHKENYVGISTVPIEMQFEEPAIIDLAEQMGCITIHAQNEQPNNNAQRRLNQQIIQDVQEEISRFKTTNRIVPKNKKGKEKEIPTVNTSKMGRFIKENLTQLEKVLQEQKKQDSKEIEKGLRQLKYRLQTIEDNYKYVSNLPDEEVESHLETAEKAARVKINDKEENRKKALYDVI
ncbi:6155_t:CDS:1 [Cetraspora pellucida]|uniref:6155_t:CDS:1 n=1 Tax=Cetraspora pellucida TaxID=1433469 RepID=A0ACA9NAM3_9GLOM|nr:6155_t:CDS:1 [Cetraspora pellucida]